MKKATIISTIIMICLIIAFVYMLKIFINYDKSNYIKYKLLVEVHYPNKTDTLTIIKKFDPRYTPEVSSFRGSNSIECGMSETCLETTAPINIISATIIK